jgi:superfamily II DNA/RNA helicase
MFLQEDYIKDLFWQSESKSFSDLSLSEDVINALKLVNIEKPTKIQVFNFYTVVIKVISFIYGSINIFFFQEKGIPVLLSGRNTQLNAETGCGKTLAFLLPAIEQVLQWKQFTPKRPFNSPLVVILTPSRELAVQIGVSIFISLFIKNLITKVKRPVITLYSFNFRLLY